MAMASVLLLLLLLLLLIHGGFVHSFDCWFVCLNIHPVIHPFIHASCITVNVATQTRSTDSAAHICDIAKLPF
jgi:hypothetical protein